MRFYLLTRRRLDAFGSEQLWPPLLALTLYGAVEGVAELCRRHLAENTHLGLGWSTGLLQATMVMLWAYIAHRRLALRGWASVRKLYAPGIFVVISLGCLDCEFLMQRFAPGLGLGAWFLASSVKMGLVRRFVWPTPPQSIEVRP